MLREQAARREAEAQREEAARTATEAQRELAALREAIAQREQAARREAELHLDLAKRLEAEALRERLTRREAEANREEAVREAAEARRELAALREVTERLRESVRQEAEARREAPVHAAAKPPVITAELVRPTLEVRSASPTDRQQQAPSPRDLWLRGATDRPTPFVAATQPIVPSASDGAADAEAPADKDGAEDTPESLEDENKRRDQRMTSRIPATVWCESRRQSFACTISDKSSSGARLEFASERFADGINELAVGNKLSLVFNAAGPGSTSVDCVVMWSAGRSCGVRFFGKFNQVSALRKAAPGKLPTDKPPAAKSTVRSFSAGAWRRPFSQAD